MIGGDTDAVALAESVFNAYIKSYVHMGPVGAGQVTKLCNKLLKSLIFKASVKPCTLPTNIRSIKPRC